MTFGRTDSNDKTGLGYIDGLEEKPDIVKSFKNSYLDQVQYIQFLD